MATPLTQPQPWIPGAVRVLLLSDAGFVAACGGRCSTRAPSDVTQPFAVIRVAGNNAITPDGVAFSPLVQVEGWCAPGGDADPESTAWGIAAQAARVLGRARNVGYESLRYSARVVDGPMPGPVDTSRGASTPLYRALVRAELTAHLVT